MNFRQMRYVLALSEELNFSHAAERLFISQPSLSQCIRAVEDELGVALFERASGRVTLTPAGTRFVELAHAILSQADQLKEEVIRASQGGRQQLRIGVSDSGSLMTPMLLPELRQRFPDVQFSFVEQAAGELEVRVLNGELDLIFTMMPTHHLDRFEILPILRDDFLIACPRALPSLQKYQDSQKAAASALPDAAAPGSATPGSAMLGSAASGQAEPADFPVLPLVELAQLPFITVKRRRFELEMERVLGDLESFRPSVIMEVANVIMALSMVAAGNGICPVPGTIVRMGPQDPRVFFCRVEGHFPTCELAVSYRKGTKLPPAALAYIDLLKTLVHERHLTR